MTIAVGRLAPGDQWDQTLVTDLINGTLYPHGLEFRWHQGYPRTEGCVLLIPGRYHHQHADQISQAIERYKWVLCMRCGDEESLLHPSMVSHPNIRWWCQTPRVGEDLGDARLMGIGYTPHMRSLPSDPPDKSVDCYLSGQNTHGRRKECFQALESWDGCKVVRPTEGFTEGFEPQEYVAGIVGAKVCPAPSGAVSPDTFRLYEALTAHCVPVADDISPAYDSRGYWRRVFGDPPFPIIEDFADLPGWIDDILADWPANANRITAWWLREKRKMAHNLVDDLKSLGAL